MDRSWIWSHNRLSKEYRDGIQSFIDVARNHLDHYNKTLCPCKDCLNTRSHNIPTIKAHLREYGFSRSYGTWIFSTEIGIVVRSHAPLNVDKWDDIPEEQTQPLIDCVLSKFDVDISRPYVKDWMLKRMRLRFNGFRNKLNKEFKSFSNKKDALENRPKYLDSQDYWVFLCDRFDSAKFQDRSDKNKKNIGELPVHRGGSKSFDQHMMEMEVEEGKAPGKITLFKKLHWSEEKGWIKPEAETLYEAMIGYLGNEDSENGSEPISEAEICIKVLGNKSGYLKGLGIVMPQKTSSSSSNVVSPENIELKEKVEHQDQLIKELQAQNEKIMAIMSKFASSNIGSFNMDQDFQLS